jgi:hypothetical protein
LKNRLSHSPFPEKIATFESGMARALRWKPPLTARGGGVIQGPRGGKNRSKSDKNVTREISPNTGRKLVPKVKPNVSSFRGIGHMIGVHVAAGEYCIPVDSKNFLK